MPIVTSSSTDQHNISDVTQVEVRGGGWVDVNSSDCSRRTLPVVDGALATTFRLGRRGSAQLSDDDELTGLLDVADG